MTNSTKHILSSVALGQLPSTTNKLPRIMTLRLMGVSLNSALTIVSPPPWALVEPLTEEEIEETMKLIDLMEWTKDE